VGAPSVGPTRDGAADDQAEEAGQQTADPIAGRGHGDDRAEPYEDHRDGDHGEATRRDPDEERGDEALRAPVSHLPPLPSADLVGRAGRASAAGSAASGGAARDLRGASGHEPRVLIARETSTATTTIEINDCTIISTFGGRESTSVSVGLNAALVLKERNR